ncbi:c-type cytochrome [Wenxinia saemankumensis]|uniref:Cytochrome c556 n=1 Tax=Wenxinia saemankumensis TaxID=1447782 RepID=A0A1M6A7M7_9RHOB|nr:cytochrome c [Wenxinia saemankumensis]SHI32447.1 Cytochrome c556 [Wenxinia saemankumensis]
MRTAFVALGLAGLATIAAAQSDPLEAAAEARESHMHLYQTNLGVLGGMARGNMDYDAEAAQAAADNLASLSDLDERFYWVEGSSSEEIDDTRALPAIWENMDDFMAKSDALHEAAVAMAEVAGDGVEAVQAQMGALGGACGSCHETYRAADD